MSGAAIDPVTFEVIKHRLWHINDEQGTTIKTVSSSPVVTEANDFNVALFTADGELAVAGPYIINHIGSMDAMIANVMDHASSVQEGDVFLCNDPDFGALHHNDVSIISPVFRDGDLVAWVMNVVHQVDIGGIDEGSFCINARDTFDEPPRFFLKIVDEGKWSNEVEYTYTKASRAPGTIELNLHAQVAAGNVAKDRLHRLFDKYGVDTVTTVMELSIDYAEDELRQFIRELPDGERSAIGYMDTRDPDTVHEVDLTLRKEGSELLFDYSGSSEQVQGGLNTTYHSCYATTTGPIFTHICDGDIDWNGAVKRVASVEAPSGTVVNATFPASVSVASIGFGRLIQQVVCKALSELLVDSDAHRDRASPSWLAASTGLNAHGTDHRGRQFTTVIPEDKAGGAAARTFADGFEHSGVLSAPRSQMANVEEYERKAPLLYLFRRQLPDSGGAGRFRGGVSGITAVAPYRADDFGVITVAQGADHSPAFGLAGGYPGSGTIIGTGTVRNRDERLEAGDIPRSIGALDATDYLAPRVDVELDEEQVFITAAPGGGGYQDPLLREPERVRRDVQSQRLAEGEAERVYGVVLTDEDDAVDDAATSARRDRLRERRLDESTVVDELSDERRERPCPRCEASPTEVRQREVELGELSSLIAKRYAGESPNFVARQSFCGDCGTLVDVTQVRR